jgi:serine/threonine protein phosphatase PrpC
MELRVNFLIYNCIKYKSIQTSKFFLLIAEPEVLITPITGKVDFVIIASDGLWDYAKVESVKEVILKGSNGRGTPSEICNQLVEIENVRRRVDDTTIILIVPKEKPIVKRKRKKINWSERVDFNGIASRTRSKT